MAENLGSGVSYVYEPAGYGYDTVVFQKGKPPMDSEVNLVQDLQRLINRRQLAHFASGWLTVRKLHTDAALSNAFYTQDPSGAVPEYALVNGFVIKVDGTAKTLDLLKANTNIIDLGSAPATGNTVNGVYLEVWRALIDPDSNLNRPEPITVVDSLRDLAVIDANFAYSVGENGLILSTENGGTTWNVQLSGTRYRLNGVDFVTRAIGWVVGDNGTILRTTSGVKWNAIVTGLTENLNGISAVSQLQVWIVGNTGTILRTTNGVTFTQISSGVTTNLRGVYFHDASVGWVVGDGGKILKTTNGGNSWISISSGTTENLNSVTFYDLMTGFVVGNKGTLLRTSDGGATWVSQSNNVWDGVSTYSSVTADLNDISMSPSLDDFIDGEEVSAQFDGSNKNCTVMYVPITRGDGLGTTTNNPADITVTVNGVAVAVDSVSGATGQIILHAAPRLCDTVKISYWHKVASGIFRGKVWAVGRVSNGQSVVLTTDNLGVQWLIQNPQTAYDLNAVAFSDRSTGWTVGDFSVIRATLDGGTTWTVQQNNALSRVVQRVYTEGNIGTPVFLDDNSIHPDTNITTTKRVQVQYRIRVVSGVDPANYPDAGLGTSATVALGPNLTGSFAYVNQGPTTGDYGLWQATCANTVDGVAWAIPMFFVSRRNLTDYNALSNANGQTNLANGAIRPDMLTANRVVESDILDVRHRTFIPDTDQLLSSTFDALSANTLRTRLVRNTTGGDKYGTEIPQLDGIGLAPGAEAISTTLTDAVGGLSSQIQVEAYAPADITATTVVPSPTSFTITGLFHSNPAYFSVTYVSAGALNGQPVPGTVSGLGTHTAVFTFSPYAATTLTDSLLFGYRVRGKIYNPPTAALTHVPATPGLVRNTTSSSSFYYFGVDSESTGTVVEQWDSGIPDRPSYVLAYPCKDLTDAAQVIRASTVEVHYFTRVTSTQIVAGSGNRKIVLPLTYQPTGDTALPYTTKFVARISNLDSGFTYKFANQIASVSNIVVESLVGFPFIEGSIIEVVSYAAADSGIALIRNGATVNFTQEDKGLGRFCSSIEALGGIISAPSTQAYVELGIDGYIKGTAVAETAGGLTQPVCWYNTGLEYTMVPCSVVSGMDSSRLVLAFADGVLRNTGDVRMQVMYQQAALPFDVSATDGLYIGYTRVPPQGADLPTSLTVEIVAGPDAVYASNLGTGGGNPGYPYAMPLEQLPVADPFILNDNVIANIEPLRFNSFSISDGFVRLPVLVPPRTGMALTFSTPSVDQLGRTFYATCSRDVLVDAEGLVASNPRKVYVAFLAVVQGASDNKFLPGEHVQVVMTRNVAGVSNLTGWTAGAECAIAVYRLNNKPLMKV